MMKKFVVLLARQRTGTTALSTALGEGQTVFSAGEVFHHGFDATEKVEKDLFIQRSTNFFLFRMGLFGEESWRSVPTLENQDHILDTYIEYLGSLNDKPIVTISVKYNSTHHLDPFYSLPGSAGHLIHQLKSRGAAFIHLKRPRRFDRYLSELLALKSGEYHRQEGEAAKLSLEPFEIDPKAAHADMLETVRLESIFDRALHSTARKIDVNYGALFDAQGRLRSVVLSKIQDLVGMDVDVGAPRTIKPTEPRWKYIANREAVVSYFDTTDFGGEVRAALGMKERTAVGLAD